LMEGDLKGKTVLNPQDIR